MIGIRGVVIFKGLSWNGSQMLYGQELLSSHSQDTGGTTVGCPHPVPDGVVVLPSGQRQLTMLSIPPQGIVQRSVSFGFAATVANPTAKINNKIFMLSPEILPRGY